MIRALVRDKRILVCVGPGGVGKTTTAAALGALAARLGKRTLVCTIDPAPRLADALGVGALSADPRPVPPEACRALGIDGPGRYLAVRLDTARAFAALVEEQVADPAMRRRIFENTIYRQITTALTGSQEYAATLALYDLATHGDYDLIVLDTPPTANALDFLEAPRRMAKFVGSQFLDDIGAFLVDFQGVLAGFLARAEQIDRLLRGPDVSFLLVLAPEVAAVDEALFFHQRLREGGIPLGTFVANRVHPRPGLVEAEAIAQRLDAQPALAGVSRPQIEGAAHRLAVAARGLAALCESERRELARLGASAPGVPVTEVPLLDHEVDNVAELRTVGDYLDETRA